MMAKYNNVNGFNSKIKIIEDTIYQLQVSRIDEFLYKYVILTCTITLKIG